MKHTRFFSVSMWKFGIRPWYAYYKNKQAEVTLIARLNTNLNLKCDFKDSYSGILYFRNTMFAFSFYVNENFVHYRKHCIAVSKTRRFY